MEKYPETVEEYPKGVANGQPYDTEKNGGKDVAIPEPDLDELFLTLKEMVIEHEHDFNFPADILDRARVILAEDTSSIDRFRLQAIVGEIQAERELLVNNSPYPEVRAVVDNTDDPSLPVNTFRAWTLGILFAIIGTGLDQFFSLRQPGIYIYSIVGQIVSYPCGTFMAWALPTKSITIWGHSFSLNPGPFNQKEHMLITIMANVSYGGQNQTAYVTYIFQSLKLDMFYGIKRLADSAGFQILLAVSTQLIGFGCAGLVRRFLVYPPAMIWPKDLATIALNKALHNDSNHFHNVHGWTISRFRFFLCCFIAMFCYFWFPDYIFQALAYFNWITWISPTNVTLAIITGSISGMGLNPWPTFDWNTLSYIFDPIIMPFFALVNNFVGMFLVGFCVIVPVYFSNAWNTAYFPINSYDVFDNTGSNYNVSRVLNADYSLNVEAYEAYSPAYLSAAYAVLYSAFFAIYLATVVHVALYNRREIVSGFKAAFQWQSARDAYGDVHNRLMKTYEEVPEWWYLVLLAIAFTLGCVVVSVYDTGMPVWGIIIGLLICLVLQIPIGMVMAITNTEVTNNVLAEFIGSYAIPNKPVANMIFKSYGYITCAQSIQFVADLKLGHYMKIPPRTLFWAQTVATIVGALVSVGVNAWQLSNIEGVCTADQSAHFSCPGKHLPQLVKLNLFCSFSHLGTHIFFTASVIWGAVGARRIFGDGGIYHPLEYGFLVGALLPVPFYFLTKKFPRSWVKYVHVPLMLAGVTWYTPYNISYVWPTVMVGFTFNYYIKHRYTAWWQKYAYVMTSSFAAGIAIAAIIIFFAVQFHSVPINWWGNTVQYAGCDGNACTLKAIPASGHF
jgi:OPT family small oligopeptide transporter